MRKPKETFTISMRQWAYICALVKMESAIICDCIGRPKLAKTHPKKLNTQTALTLHYFLLAMKNKSLKEVLLETEQVYSDAQVAQFFKVSIPIARKMISDHNKIIRPAEGFINKTDLQYLMEFNAEYIRILKRNPLLKLQKKKNYTDFGFMNYLHVGRNLFEDIMKGRSLCSFQAPEGTIIAYKMWFEKISRVREGCGLKG